LTLTFRQPIAFVAYSLLIHNGFITGGQAMPGSADSSRRASGGLAQMMAPWKVLHSLMCFDFYPNMHICVPLSCGICVIFCQLPAAISQIIDNLSLPCIRHVSMATIILPSMGTTITLIDTSYDVCCAQRPWHFFV
jgi:hypothetical protein